MTTDSKVNIEAEKAACAVGYEELQKKYGTVFRAPYEERSLVSERLRAAHCIATNPDVPIRQTLRHYAVDQRVWPHFLDDAEEFVEGRKLSRAEKQSLALDWASNNVGKQVTLDEIIKECDVSYSMAKKLTEDRLDVFRKVKRGLFEIRDPRADREADKAATKSESEDSAEEN